MLTFILGEKTFSRYSTTSGRSCPSQYPFLFLPYTHPSLNSHQFAVRSETPFPPFCELHRTSSIPIIFTAEFSLCRCFATASHTPFGEARHMAIFRYSQMARATPSSKNKDCLLTCLPRRGQGGGDRVSYQFRSQSLSDAAHLLLLFTRLPKASLNCTQSFHLTS